MQLFWEIQKKMRSDTRALPDKLTIWRRRAIDNYSGTESKLPVSRHTLTQIGSGRLSSNIDLVSSSNLTVYRSNINVNIETVVSAVMDKAFTAFMMVQPFEKELRFNGELATPTKIYLPDTHDSINVLGGKRDIVSIGVRRDALGATLAALQGVDREDIKLGGLVLELPSDVAHRMRSRTLAVLDGISSQGHIGFGRRSLEEFEHAIIPQVIEVYLKYHCGAGPTLARGGWKSRVVRKAEDRFFEADWEPISIADLCLAAGVGRTALYIAFQDICGESPLAYFKKRRLNKAHQALLNSRPTRGAVTSAATAAGMSELGRFSAEYYSLFGELPSVTLRRALSD